MTYRPLKKNPAITSALAAYAEYEVLFGKAAIFAQDGFLSYLERSIENSRNGVDDTEEYRQHSLAHKIAGQSEIARTVDSFQKYVSDLLTQVFELHPYTFFKRKIDVADLFSAQSLDDFRRDIIESQVNELTYKGVFELAQFVSEKANFELFSNRLTFLRVSRLFEIRNCIVHNRGRVDKKFVGKTNSKKLVIGDLVPAPHPLMVRKYLFNCAIDVDDRAVSKFAFPETRLLRTIKSDA